MTAKSNAPEDDNPRILRLEQVMVWGLDLFMALDGILKSPARAQLSSDQITKAEAACAGFSAAVQANSEAGAR